MRTNKEKIVTLIESLTKLLETEDDFDARLTEWLKRDGFDGEEEAFLKYDRNALEWAMDNAISVHDFEHWQAWKRVLKNTPREITLELAMRLDAAIAEFDSAMSVYDFE